MNIEQAVMGKLFMLSPEKKQEVLDFVEFLAQKTPKNSSPQSLKGLWADLSIEITEEDILELRNSGNGN